MKAIKNSFFIFAIFFANTILVNAQEAESNDSTGLPGDNFSLQGALEMFKNSSSPEEFEKKLNSEDNHVNNLDLNGDGDIDYIRVIDKSEGDVHAFVLQVPVSENENQDIAVIELEKTGDSEATLQIIGDEEIYGTQTIVEPVDDDQMKGEERMQRRHRRGGPDINMDESIEDVAIFINVWPWPCVRFAYAPGYHPWVSPWRWRSYPGYWHPWRPLGWRVFHPYRARYFHGYGFAATHRVVRAHGVYAPIRASSVTVRTRHAGAVEHYRVTRTKTTVGPRGHVKTTRTTKRGTIRR